MHLDAEIAPRARLASGIIGLGLSSEARCFRIQMSCSIHIETVKKRKKEKKKKLENIPCWVVHFIKFNFD
jgi:hypothetical protein